MQFDWWTLGLQTVNVLILIWLLRRFLFKPVLGLIRDRRQEVERAFQEAGLEGKKAKEAESRLESQQRELAQQAEGILEESHVRARETYDDTLEKARSEAKQLLETARRRIEDERRDALIELRDKTFDLSVELARRLLGELDPDTVSQAFMASMEKYLGSLPDDELSELRRQLAEGAQPLVVTASPLDPAERQRWLDMLAGILGSKTQIRFEADDALIAGAELHFRHAVMRFSWRDKLVAARKAFAEDEDSDADARAAT